MTNQTFDEQLKEKLSESAIILEANRDANPLRYGIALDLFLGDAIAQIKAVIREHMPEKKKQNLFQTIDPAYITEKMDSYNKALDDIEKRLGL